jgi:hypothetical protein
MNKLRLYAMTICASAACMAAAQNTPLSQMEQLNRGVYLIRTESKNGIRTRKVTIQ